MAYGKLNSIRMKAINKNIVLQVIRSSGRISRKDLAIRVGLTAATITNLVNECITAGEVIESGSGESAGGRKPVFLELNPHAGYVFGVELNVSRIICILANFKTEVMDFEVELTEIEKGPEYTIDQIAGIIQKMRERNGISAEKVMSIGLVSSGPLDRKKGVMINPPNFTGWGTVPIKEMVEAKTGIKTLFEKDTNGAALGEYWFGQLSNSKKLFFLCVNFIGIGGGMVTNGDIYHGAYDNAPDIGHIIVDNQGSKCKCGKNGCLEAVADGKAALIRVNDKIKNAPRFGLTTYSNFREFLECAEKGDPLCIEAIEETACYLNIAMINIVQLFSPDAILLGGEFFDGCKLLYDKTLERFYDLPYPPFIQDTLIRQSSFQEKSSAMGGIAMVFRSLNNVQQPGSINERSCLHTKLKT